MLEEPKGVNPLYGQDPHTMPKPITRKGSIGGRSVEEKKSKEESEIGELGKNQISKTTSSSTEQHLVIGQNSDKLEDLNSNIVEFVKESLLLDKETDEVADPLHLKAEIASLNSLIERANAKNVENPRGYNAYSPELFKIPVYHLIGKLKSSDLQESIQGRPFLMMKHAQLLNSLKHLNLESVSIDPGYPHAPILEGSYPFEATLNVLNAAKTFFYALEGSEPSEIPHESPDVIQARLKALEKEESTYIKKIVANPIEMYGDYKQRLKTEGHNAKFPEFGTLVEYLQLSLKKEGISTMADKDPALAIMRRRVFDELNQVKDAGYPYCKVIDTIENCLGFLDVYERGISSEVSTQLFHSFKYEYYSSFIKNEVPNHILFPTFSGLGATDLLKVRGVPIGFSGVHTESSWVDGFSQSPLEFWYHDINHTRRMWQFFKEEAQNQGISIDQFAEKSNQFTRDELIPLITIKKSEDYEVQNQKRMMKMILFEMLHEDALSADRSVIKKALMRAPNTPTPSESMTGNKIHYNMEEGATTLAFVYRKIAGDFYDMEGMRNNFIIAHDRRTQKHVVEAAFTMNQQLNLGADLDMMNEYTRNDEGFPEGFLQSVKEFIIKHPEIMAPLSTDK
jgi:hypothetical protein